MKKIFGWVALLMGMVTGANAQVNDTIQRVTGNDLYQGITRKLPYRQMVTPHGVQVTFAISSSPRRCGTWTWEAIGLSPGKRTVRRT